MFFREAAGGNQGVSTS